MTGEGSCDTRRLSYTRGSSSPSSLLRDGRLPTYATLLILQIVELKMTSQKKSIWLQKIELGVYEFESTLFGIMNIAQQHPALNGFSLFEKFSSFRPVISPDARREVTLQRQISPIPKIRRNPRFYLN